jgi:hypothetical protein
MLIKKKHVEPTSRGVCGSHANQRQRSMQPSRVNSEPSDRLTTAENRRVSVLKARFSVTLR